MRIVDRNNSARENSCRDVWCCGGNTRKMLGVRLFPAPPGATFPEQVLSPMEGAVPNWTSLELWPYFEYARVL